MPSSSDLIGEDYGNVRTLNFLRPNGSYLLSDDIDRASCCAAEIFGMLAIIMHIIRTPTLFHAPTLIRYDSENARRILTGQFTNRDPNLVSLSNLVKRILRTLNEERRAHAELELGYSATNGIEANIIHWQWVRAHTGKDLGNSWVDYRAKSGADGFSPTNPPPDQEANPFPLSEEQLLADSDDGCQDVEGSPANSVNLNLRTAANLIAELSAASTSPTATARNQQSLFRFIPISDLVDSDSDEDKLE